MAPPSLWSGNLRLSLVLIPVRLIPAVSTEEAISFRQIHEPSGQPIKYVKGVRDGDTFTEVPEEEIVKGYEHAKGHHVLIHPKEIEELKLEAKHTIDMVRFVDEDEIDTRYFEKPYYLHPDGDEADEGYAIIRDALKRLARSPSANSSCRDVSTLLASKPLGRGLMLSILRYANELREPTPYFENITAEPKAEAVKLAAELIERQSGRFEPHEDARSICRCNSGNDSGQDRRSGPRGDSRIGEREAANRRHQHHGCAKGEHGGEGTRQFERCGA